MKFTLDIAKLIHRKGLEHDVPYVGTVIDNIDPVQQGRIKVRIPHFFDHLSDAQIPWAIPEDWSHPQGLKGGRDTDRTGHYPAIPVEETKVALYFRHDGDAMRPSYSTRIPIDAKNQLPEFTENYPYRLGTKLSNGYTHIIDTRTNEVFIQNPGDMNITILGDSNVQVVGNLQVDVLDSKSNIPGYILNAPETVLSELSANPSGQVPFNGLFGGGSGNAHIKTSKHLTFDVGGKFKLVAASSVDIEAGSTMNLKAGPSITARASMINLN